jgi:hypothetical protein
VEQGTGGDSQALAITTIWTGIETEAISPSDVTGTSGNNLPIAEPEDDKRSR